MNQQIEIGQINTLLIDRITPPGIFLTSLSGEAVLLPNRYVTPQMQVFDTLEVFVYTDSEDRIVATTEFPAILAGQFGCFEVVDTAKFGAFIDIGLMKDILVPKNRQKTIFRQGEKKIVYLLVDEHTHRLMADERIERYINTEITDLQIKEEVELLVYAKTPMGYKVIINHTYAGMIFNNEIFEPLYVGAKKKGYIKNIREDGKIDVVLQPVGRAKKDNAAQKIMELLNKYQTLPFTYKSEADEISNTFGVSKKAFKAALTTLIDSKEIVLEADLIRKL